MYIYIRIFRNYDYKQVGLNNQIHKVFELYKKK